MDYKVYVMLGFHINFYHSWRGDTPDEAGFGTDMRVIRGILDILEKATAAGKRARAYWDTEVYWTFQEIVPKHCPDILQRMRARVSAGLDEIVPGPFNNGANHAATRDEFRAAVEWALENPWGSGLRQLFPNVAPFYRSQEIMFTTGQETILKECGIEGLMLYYALVPFNALAAFTPALSIQQRYNPFWFRSDPKQPRMVAFPCLSAADVVDMVSLEHMLLDLHERQLKGEIQSDVVIHLNEDADLETWLPMKLPKPIRWFPNTGGLQEYIDVVNRYPWADFTVPSQYLSTHPPQHEVIVRQDLADGAFDGSYSWAEKCASLRLWTELEQSRLASYRAEALAQRTGLDLSPILWDGMESSFFKRLIGLTTTHFGMSTPVINEERQARAFSILGEARQLAESAERRAAQGVRQPGATSLYEFEVIPTPPARDAQPAPARSAVTIPLILPGDIKSIALIANGQTIPASLTDGQALPDGQTFWQLRFTADIKPGEAVVYQVLPKAQGDSPAARTRLQNAWLDVEFSEATGIQSINLNGKPIGDSSFLSPFISYRTQKNPIVYPAARWEIVPLKDEHLEGLQRVRLRAHVPMQTPHGEFTNQFTYTFSLFDVMPYLYVDVEARYAYTPPADTIHNMIQKLRRLMDLRWVEVAPFQLHPALQATGANPLRIWKHNYIGITAWYNLDYGQINPRNRNLDAFNHQVTAGWVAASDGQKGLLVGENAEELASMAFCPMRLREENGHQQLWLNPFGSYHGKMLDYSHIGATGIGADFLKVFGGFLRPNGPSFNGQTVRFSLMLAPYSGDQPPLELQASAAAHFYPPEVIFHTTPPAVKALLSRDILKQVLDERTQAQVHSDQPVPMPGAFLANPAAGQVDLVWDAPRDTLVTGYEVAWRAADEPEWHSQSVTAAPRWQVPGLQDGRKYIFKLRAVRGIHRSEWTAEQGCTPGAVTDAGLGSLTSLPIWSLIRMVFRSIGSVIRARLRNR